MANEFNYTKGGFNPLTIQFIREFLIIQTKESNSNLPIGFIFPKLSELLLNMHPGKPRHRELLHIFSVGLFMGFPSSEAFLAFYEEMILYGFVTLPSNSYWNYFAV